MTTGVGSQASISLRAAALAIDAAVFVSLAMPLAVFCRELAGPDADAAPWVCLVAFSLIYWIGFAYRWETLGKWFIGLRVIDHQGRPPSLAQCLKRSFYPGIVWASALVSVPGANWIGGSSNRGTPLSQLPHALSLSSGYSRLNWIRRPERPTFTMTGFPERMSSDAGQTWP